jgi:hypothetical protein
VSDTDPYIGETFEDRDSRSTARRVRVLSLEVAGRIGMPGSHRYLVEVVSNLGAPSTVGRKYKMLGRTLTNHYKKVSH